MINLASQPFRRDRPVVVAAVVLGLLMTALFAAQVSIAVMERGQSAETRAAIERLEKRVTTLAAEQAKLEAIQREPANAQVIDRNVFLNSLIYRKAVSWTRIFHDLEQTMPYNVRVISIRPFLTPRNEVMLEMNVGSEQTQPVLDMLMRLEKSDRFGATTVSTRMAPSQNDPLFRYKVNVNYAQRF